MKVGDTITITRHGHARRIADKRHGRPRHRVREPGRRGGRVRHRRGASRRRRRCGAPKVDLPEVRFDDQEARFREVMGRVKARSSRRCTTAIVASLPTPTSLAGAVAARGARASSCRCWSGRRRKIRERRRGRASSTCAASRIVAVAAQPRGGGRWRSALAREGEVEGDHEGQPAHRGTDRPRWCRPTTGLRTERRVSHVHRDGRADLSASRCSSPTAMINIAPDAGRQARHRARTRSTSPTCSASRRPRWRSWRRWKRSTRRCRPRIDAATLCKMAERGQITGGILDGPLDLRSTRCRCDAAETTGIRSPVAGQADILVVPDLESGNMIAKQLAYLADALSAGIVLGARVPIALTSRADDRRAWLASATLVQLVAHMYRQTAAGARAAE
ncbi:MAG: phosphate acyltransferase [Comamonadaceae bacterium]|nr:phosphate acyltransferase [Comamonadaceae bacterium]